MIVLVILVYMKNLNYVSRLLFQLLTNASEQNIFLLSKLQLKSYRLEQVKSSKKFERAGENNFRIDRLFSHYSPVSHKARIVTRPRICSTNHLIKQHLACVVSTCICVHIIRRWGRFVEWRSRSRNAIKECITWAVYCIQIVEESGYHTLRYLDTPLSASQRCVPSFNIHRSAGMWSCLCIILTTCIYHSSMLQRKL